MERTIPQWDGQELTGIKRSPGSSLKDLHVPLEASPVSLKHLQVPPHIISGFLLKASPGSSSKYLQVLP